jgi:hypothetical protein
MESLIEKIIESLEKRRDAVFFCENTENEFSAIAFKEGITVAIEEIKEIEKHCNFEEAARVLIKYMNRLHPHHNAIVTSTSAELFEGKESRNKIYDYLTD